MITTIILVQFKTNRKMYIEIIRYLLQTNILNKKLVYSTITVDICSNMLCPILKSL